MTKNNNLQKAVIFSILSALSFSIMAFFVKKAAPFSHNNQVIFFRFSVSFLYILLVLGIRHLIKKPISLKTKYLKLHLLRAFFSLAGMMSFYYSLKFITLVNANVLIMTSPLFVAIIKVLYFKNKIKLTHWIVIFIGFIGILFILKPGMEIFKQNSLYGLASGIIIALAFITIRKIGKHDNPTISMFYYFLLAFIISSIISIFRWQPLDHSTIINLLLAGITGTFYQEFLIRAFTYAPAKIVSSLLYISLIFSIFLGFIFFHNFPGVLSWIGIILVSFCSIFVVQAEKNSLK